MSSKWNGLATAIRRAAGGRRSSKVRALTSSPSIATSAASSSTRSRAMTCVSCTRLIGRADVFLTNNPRLESLARVGLDPATLARAAPAARVRRDQRLRAHGTESQSRRLRHHRARRSRLDGAYRPGRRRAQPLPHADGRHLGRNLHLHRRARGPLCSRQPRRRQQRRATHRRRARRCAVELARQHRRELLRYGQTAVAARQRACRPSRRISRYGHATKR